MTRQLFRTCMLGSMLFFAFHCVAVAQTRTWTSDADFDAGTLSDVVHAPANQLNLGPTIVSRLHSVWATNYGYGYVVRLDTRTGKQTGRYDSALEYIDGVPTGARPPRETCNLGYAGNCPGRIAVDSDGNAWVINRAFGLQGTMTKIAGDIAQCVDRNGNLVIDTSVDANGDGIIDVTSPAEYFGQNDECLITTIAVGLPGDIPRAVAVDRNGKIWAGTYADGKAYRYAPHPLALETSVNLGAHAYAMSAGGDYVLVSNPGVGGTKRIHTTTLGVDSAPCPSTYGVVASPAGDVGWLGGLTSGTNNIYKADFTAHTCSAIPVGGMITAVTLDASGNVWGAAYHNATVVKVSPAGTLLGTYGAGGSYPHGVAVDFDGYLWTVLHGPPSLSKINAATGALVGAYTIGGPGIPDADPYVYGDYTGAELNRQVPYRPTGSWDAVYDGGTPGLAWAAVRWNAEPEGGEPSGTSIAVSVRAADTLPALAAAPYAPTGNGSLLSGIQGRYVQVRAELAGPRWATPTLSDVSVEGPCPVPGEDCCIDDGDCNDLNTCTTDTCPTAGGACAHVWAAGCCIADGDCTSLDDDCNRGACNPASNACETAPVNAGGSCDDGDACTTATTCDGSGQCVGGALIDCDDGDPCTQDTCSGGCLHADAPDPTCLSAPGASLLVKAGASAEKDGLRWSWKAGGEITQADLGDPRSSATYELCIYDSTAGSPSLAARLRVDPSDAWTSKDPKGYAYKDPAGTEAGVIRAQLKTGAAAKARIVIVAKGAGIPMPVPFSSEALFDQDPRVTVQLHNDASSKCYGSELTSAKVNTGTLFKARMP